MSDIPAGACFRIDSLCYVYLAVHATNPNLAKVGYSTDPTRDYAQRQMKHIVRAAFVDRAQALEAERVLLGWAKLHGLLSSAAPYPREGVKRTKLAQFLGAAPNDTEDLARRMAALFREFQPICIYRRVVDDNRRTATRLISPTPIDEAVLASFRSCFNIEPPSEFANPAAEVEELRIERARVLEDAARRKMRLAEDLDRETTRMLADIDRQLQRLEALDSEPTDESMHVVRRKRGCLWKFWWG
ncbi:hypothetical protein DFJ74DRAFT_645337 [Hyaloraphidium curvatum]|nr:hypothetical protein DFJ74DRAFT_645337 [Hyaloraphidium curvatum]